jgi:hypothetical protein
MSFSSQFACIKWGFFDPFCVDFWSKNYYEIEVIWIPDFKKLYTVSIESMRGL